MLQMLVSCARSLPAFAMIAASSVFRSGITPGVHRVALHRHGEGVALVVEQADLAVQGFDSQKMSHGTFMPAMSLPILSLRQPMPSIQTTYGTV